MGTGMGTGAGSLPTAGAVFPAPPAWELCPSGPEILPCHQMQTCLVQTGTAAPLWIKKKNKIQNPNQTKHTTPPPSPFFTVFTESSFARLSPRAMKKGGQVPPERSVVRFRRPDSSLGPWLVPSPASPREGRGRRRPLVWPRGTSDAVALVRAGHVTWPRKRSLPWRRAVLSCQTERVNTAKAVSTEAGAKNTVSFHCMFTGEAFSRGTERHCGSGLKGFGHQPYVAVPLPAVIVLIECNIKCSAKSPGLTGTSLHWWRNEECELCTSGAEGCACVDLSVWRWEGKDFHPRCCDWPFGLSPTEIPPSSDSSPCLGELQSLCVGSACTLCEERDGGFGPSPPLILATCRPWRRNIFFWQAQKFTKIASTRSHKGWQHQPFPQVSQYPSFHIYNKAACFYLDTLLLLAASIYTRLVSFQNPGFWITCESTELRDFPLNIPSFLYFWLASVRALYHAQYIMPVIRVTVQ